MESNAQQHDCIADQDDGHSDLKEVKDLGEGGQRCRVIDICDAQHKHTRNGGRNHEALKQKQEFESHRAALIPHVWDKVLHKEHEDANAK
jgi:hypothetical protein